MYTLITFATQWGSKYGGVNSFNADFLTAFAFAYRSGVQTVCVVASSTSEAREYASKANVQLVTLPYAPEASSFDPSHGQASVDELRRLSISFDPNKTLWLGHDRITGEAAVAAAEVAGGRSAIIHHMSYDHYESYAKNSQSADRRRQEQTTLFQKADLVLAIGPLLRDALNDRLSGTKTVHMLVPGLAEIEPQEAPKTFVAFLSGRLSDNAARIKQGHLGIAAFARAQREAQDSGMPDALCKQPKLLLRGIDFEGRGGGSSSSNQQDPETELKKFAEGYADAVVNLHALPYTYDRQQLYSELSRASVALMPSWHEGFGLVGWEAIAAGIPLIISKNSGVYQLLEEEYPGAGPGCVYPLDIRGAMSSPFFHEEDLKATVIKLKEVAKNPHRARQQAGILRNMLGEKTWASCAEQAVVAFDWDLKKGSMPVTTPEKPPPTASIIPLAPSSPENDLNPLQMPAGRWRAGAGMADSQLLRAEEALLPFDPARQPDVDELNAWLDDTQWPESVRLITGAGGQGKTRLALELCQQRLRLGWHVGFLDSDIEANRMTSNWQALRKLNQPLLIVVDYAETRQEAFLALLKASLQNPVDKPVRMLLLARDAGEWWENLPSRDPQCEALLSGYATSGPFRLSPLYVADPDRREAYTKALYAFAQMLGVNVPDIVPDLQGEHFERPLYVQMAALLALYGERPTTAQGLTKALLNHERRYWQGLLVQFHLPEPERRAEQLLTLTTLAGGFATPKAAEPYWEKAKAKIISLADFNSLFRALATLYPGTQGLQALRPDLLGEALVAQALLRLGADTLLDAVLTNSAAQSIRRHALTVLARLSTQRPDLREILVDAMSRHFRHCCLDIVAVGTETTSRLPKLAELAFARLSPADKSQAAGLLIPLLEEQSIQLAGLSCIVSEYLTEKLQEKFNKKPRNLELMAKYACALDTYGIKLAQIGQYQRASDIALKAVNLYSQLKVKEPKRFEHDYATSVINYATHLSDAGQHEAALDHTRRGVEIYQRLTQKNSDLIELNYATSLNNYANRLSDARRNQEALDYARQALEINQRLAQKDLARFEPSYARSLNNYANRLSDTGRHEEALDYGRQSMEIRQRLAQKNPDRFEPDYTMSLNNYSSYLVNLGRYEDALDHIRQAVEIYQRLAQKNPDRFEPDYALSLNNYATCLSDIGRNEDSLHYARRALEIRQRLAQKEPNRFAEEIFISTCFVRFLAWLCEQDWSWYEPSSEQITAFVSPQRRSRLLLYLAFVDACSSTSHSTRTSACQQVLSIWDDLSIADKTDAKIYWLCAAAWCAKFGQIDLVEIQWEASFRQYIKQRNGQPQQWMLEVARRLEFQWPQ